MRYALGRLIGLLFALTTQFAGGAEAFAVSATVAPQTAAGSELRADVQEQGGANNQTPARQRPILASWIDDADDDSDDPSHGVNVPTVGPASYHTLAQFLILPGTIRAADVPVPPRSSLQRYRKLLI